MVMGVGDLDATHRCSTLKRLMWPDENPAAIIPPTSTNVVHGTAERHSLNLGTAPPLFDSGMSSCRSQIMMAPDASALAKVAEACTARARTSR
jgi:hypothetical protein